MASTDPRKNGCGRICPYCRFTFDELSLIGFENHVEFCRVVIGVPNVRISTQTASEQSPQRHGVAN